MTEKTTQSALEMVTQFLDIQALIIGQAIEQQHAQGQPGVAEAMADINEHRAYFRVESIVDAPVRLVVHIVQRDPNRPSTALKEFTILLPLPDVPLN
jgi:hypothetical protein